MGQKNSREYHIDDLHDLSWFRRERKQDVTPEGQWEHRTISIAFSCLLEEQKSSVGTYHHGVFNLVVTYLFICQGQE